jgi:hypothetical protein
LQRSDFFCGDISLFCKHVFEKKLGKNVFQQKNAAFAKWKLKKLIQDLFTL